MKKLGMIIPMVLVGTLSAGVNDGMKLIPANGSYPAFWIDSTEVTQEAWMKLMDENPSLYQEALCPVEQVTWYDAARYANELSKSRGLDTAYSGSGSNMSFISGTNGYRLPEREEWRFAAEGHNSVTPCYWGNCDENTGEYAWFGGMYFNGGFNPHPVAQKKPNAHGLYDITGNVSEWTNTTFSQNMSQKEYRGGHYITDSVAEEFETRYINYEHPSDKSYTRGFRLVRTDIEVSLQKPHSVASKTLEYAVQDGRISFNVDEKIQSIQILSVTGALIHRTNNSSSIDLRALGLSTGMYLFQVKTEKALYKEIITVK